MVMAVIVTMIVMMAVIMVVIVVMVVILAVQEIRLDIEDAVEIEGVAVQHLVDRDLRALRCGAASRKD